MLPLINNFVYPPHYKILRITSLAEGFSKIFLIVCVLYTLIYACIMIKNKDGDKKEHSKKMMKHGIFGCVFFILVIIVAILIRTIFQE